MSPMLAGLVLSLLSHTAAGGGEHVAFPLVFVANEGQLEEGVRFRARLADMTVDVHVDGWSLHPGHPEPEEADRTGRITLVGASAGAWAEGLDALRATATFVGPDGTHSAATFGRVRLRGVWPGVDVVLRGQGGRVEYDLHLAAGVDPGVVVLRVDGELGGAGTRVEHDGSPVIRVGGIELVQSAPVAWQVGPDGARRDVGCRFRRVGPGAYGFELTGRAPGLPLVIDPVLVYREMVGGSHADAAQAVAVDAEGGTYVAGWARSADFPGDPGRARAKDVAVFKLDAGGHELEYVLFVGGSGDDEATGIAVNEAGEATVVGRTRSPDFPATPQTHQRQRAGGDDAFVLRVAADGKGLLWATHLGGSSDDEATGLALGADGSAYVVGSTRSSDFPASLHALQRTRRGGVDAFAARLDDHGRVLLYATYLGGTRDDRAAGVALDPEGHAVVVGRTDSSDYPVSSGAFDTRPMSSEAFVTKLGLRGDRSVFSTFLGGSARDEARAVAVASSGEVWVAGWTESDDFPVTPDAFLPARRGRRDGFLARLSVSGGVATYGSFVGGAGNDEVAGLALDPVEGPWIVGSTASDDLQRAGDGGQEARGGGLDGFLLGVDARSGRLLFATYLGSRGHEELHAVASQPGSGDLVVVGHAENVAPSERGRFGGGKQGPADALVARFTPGLCSGRAEMTVLGTGVGAQLEASAPQLGRPYRMRVHGAPPGARGYVLISPATSSARVVEELGELHVDPDRARVLLSFTIDETGEWVYDATLPALEDLCGRTFVLQAVTLDRRLGPLSFGQLSQGLLMTLGG